MLLNPKGPNVVLSLACRSQAQCIYSIRCGNLSTTHQEMNASRPIWGECERWRTKIQTFNDTIYWTYEKGRSLFVGYSLNGAYHVQHLWDASTNRDEKYLKHRCAEVGWTQQSPGLVLDHTLEKVWYVGQ
jgi:hypothetical protein